MYIYKLYTYTHAICSVSLENPASDSNLASLPRASFFLSPVHCHFRTFTKASFAWSHLPPTDSPPHCPGPQLVPATHRPSEIIQGQTQTHVDLTPKSVHVFDYVCSMVH